MVQPSSLLWPLAALLLASTAAPAAPRAVVPLAPGGGAATPAAAAPPIDAVGLYPLQLPDGLRAFSEKLTAQLRDGAAGLPHLRALEPLPRGACLFDESGCLADEARPAKLGRLVSGRVVQGERGYSFELRLVSTADGRELGAERGSVEGGPLDLAGGMEHGLCALLGGDPCLGSLSVRAPESGAGHLFVDGADRGPLPIDALALPIGRHLVRAGSDERRVRIANQRETRLACVERDSALALLDDSAASTEAAPPGAPATALVAAPTPALSPGADDAPLLPRSRAGRIALAAGGALLMTAAGVELYARAQSAVLDSRYQSGQLTSADAASYGHVHTAGVAALVLGATGVGALAIGGVLLLLSPDGAAVQGKF